MMQQESLLAKAERALARVGIDTRVLAQPATHDLLPPQPAQPVLDGKHIAIGEIDDESGHYMILFEPYVACVGGDGTRCKAGTYYHAGYMFVDAHTLRLEAEIGSKASGGASVEYTKRPLHVDHVKRMLHVWRLDGRKISWEYLPSKGEKRNLFWMSGDASWAEAQNVCEIKDLEARMGKAMRSLGEKMRWDQHSWLGMDYEVTKKNRLAIAKARLDVENIEARAALRKAGSEKSDTEAGH